MDFNGNTALHLAAAHRKSTVVVAYLIESGADVNARNQDGDTPMHRVGYSDAFGIASMSRIARGVERRVNWLSKMREAVYSLGLAEPPDDYTVFDRQINVYEVLVGSGANFEKQNNAGYAVKIKDGYFRSIGFEVEEYGEKCDLVAGVCFGVDWTVATLEDVRNMNLRQADKDWWMPIHYAVANSRKCIKSQGLIVVV